MSKNKNPSTEAPVHGARTLSSQQADASKNDNSKNRQQQAVVLDRAAPMDTARTFRNAWPTLSRFDDKFWDQESRRYHFSEAEIESSVWRFLERAFDPGGKPFGPRLKDVKEIVSALKAVAEPFDRARP